MTTSIILTILTIAGLLYQWKYYIQLRKILQLHSSKGVSRTYFLISITYELVCTIGAVILQNWILFTLSILPLIGNSIVFVVALKYAPESHKKTLKAKLYRYIRRLLK